MKATVTWLEDMRFECQSDTGHQLIMDGDGGHVSPMEAVLMAVGACSSIDVVEILRKARQQITSCHCKLEADRAEDAPRVFTQIRATYYVKGQGINEKHLARAVQLSCEKYCSVMLMLNSKVPVSTSYVIDQD